MRAPRKHWQRTRGNVLSQDSPPARHHVSLLAFHFPSTHPRPSRLYPEPTLPACAPQMEMGPSVPPPSAPSLCSATAKIAGETRSASSRLALSLCPSGQAEAAHGASPRRRRREEGSLRATVWRRATARSVAAPRCDALSGARAGLLCVLVLPYFARENSMPHAGQGANERPRPIPATSERPLPPPAVRMVAGGRGKGGGAKGREGRPEIGSIGVANCRVGDDAARPLSSVDCYIALPAEGATTGHVCCVSASLGWGWLAGGYGAGVNSVSWPLLPGCSLRRDDWRRT